MIVVNQQDLAQTANTAQVPVTQQRIITQQIPSNGTVVETKPSPSNASTNAQHRLTQQVITPMGPLTLTADEYNELMQRRMQKAHNDEVQRKAQQEAQERANQEAVQRAHQEAQQRAAQQQHQQMQDHQNIAVQVQKIVQSLEEDIGDSHDDKKDEDIEMQLIVPKMETESVQGDEGTSSDNKANEKPVVDKNAGRPFACDKCGKKFLLKHHLTTHARVHSGEL